MQPEQTYTPPVGQYPAQNQQKQKKIIGAIIALGALLIIVALAIALLSSPDQTQRLGVVTAKQQEAVRLLDEYGDDASSSQTKALVASSSVVLKSDLRNLQSLGASPTVEQQQAAVIAGIDEVLADAIRSNRFDQTLTDYLTNVVDENKATVQEVLDASDDEGVKAALRPILENYDNLL